MCDKDNTLCKAITRTLKIVIFCLLATIILYDFISILYTLLSIVYTYLSWEWKLPNLSSLNSPIFTEDNLFDEGFFAAACFLIACFGAAYTYQTFKRERDKYQKEEKEKEEARLDEELKQGRDKGSDYLYKATQNFVDSKDDFSKVYGLLDIIYHYSIQAGKYCRTSPFAKEEFDRADNELARIVKEEYTLISNYLSFFEMFSVHINTLQIYPYKVLNYLFNFRFHLAIRNSRIREVAFIERPSYFSNDLNLKEKWEMWKRMENEDENNNNDNLSEKFEKEINDFFEEIKEDVEKWVSDRKQDVINNSHPVSKLICELICEQMEKMCDRDDGNVSLEQFINDYLDGFINIYKDKVSRIFEQDKYRGLYEEDSRKIIGERIEIMQNYSLIPIDYDLAGRKLSEFGN